LSLYGLRLALFLFVRVYVRFGGRFVEVVRKYLVGDFEHSSRRLHHFALLVRVLDERADNASVEVAALEAEIGIISVAQNVGSGQQVKTFGTILFVAFGLGKLFRLELGPGLSLA
jgi:hypothetical protein